MRAYRYESRIWLSIVNKQNFTQSTRVSEMICAVFDTAIVAWASYAPMSRVQSHRRVLEFIIDRAAD